MNYIRKIYHVVRNATEGSPNSGLCPILIEWLKEFFIVRSTVDSTTHSRPLNSLEHCIYMHNLNKKHSTSRGYEPSTFEFRAGLSEPS